MSGSVNLKANPFLTSGSQATGAGAGTGATPPPSSILEVVIRKAENLPPLEPGSGRKLLPICTCEVSRKAGTRIQTGTPTNLSQTDPIFGHDPDYFKAHISNWVDGDTLTFTIQDQDGSQANVVAMCDLTYAEYKNGFEWWLPLKVKNLKRYPAGYPYAAIQIKVNLVQKGVSLSTDPFMSNKSLAQSTSSRGFCNNCCLPWRMWCCRRWSMCGLCVWFNTKWCGLMSMLFCSLGCFECNKLCSMTWGWCSGRDSLKDLRRDCAKRFKLPDADDEEEEMDTACCCVPLRTAVFVISLFSTISAVMAFFFPRFVSDSDQRFSGGYAVQSRVIVGALQVLGLFFGPVGMLGAMDLNVNLLNTYNYFQIIRMCGMVFMFYTDVPLLTDCNIWRTDINEAIRRHGWNPAMYNVAMGNACLQVQMDFILGVCTSMVMYAYLISLTRRLIWDTEKTPRYLLSMPRPSPNGAFLSHSRTQGKAKPPYGALLGYENYKQTGNLEAIDRSGLVGPPVGAPQFTAQFGRGGGGQQPTGRAPPGFKF